MMGSEEHGEEEGPVRRVTVENNQQIGVLIDGTSTQVVLDGTTVRGNNERGVWIQNVNGDGGVTITGGEVSNGPAEPNGVNAFEVRFSIK